MLNKKNTDYKGVYYNGHSIYAKITKDQKEYYLGTFKTYEEAAEAYNKKALEFYGTYALLNDVRKPHDHSDFRRPLEREASHMQN